MLGWRWTDAGLEVAYAGLEVPCEGSVRWRQLAEGTRGQVGCSARWVGGSVCSTDLSVCSTDLSVRGQQTCSSRQRTLP